MSQAGFRVSPVARSWIVTLVAAAFVGGLITGRAVLPASGPTTTELAAPAPVAGVGLGATSERDALIQFRAGERAGLGAVSVTGETALLRGAAAERDALIQFRAGERASEGGLSSR